MRPRLRIRPQRATRLTIGFTTVIRLSIVSASYGAGSSTMNVSKPDLAGRPASSRRSAPASPSRPTRRRPSARAACGCARARPRSARLASASVERIVILQPTRALDRVRVPADVRAVGAQDRVLGGQRLGRAERVPHVGVAGDDPQRLLLARAADHDRQVGLDGRRLDPEVVEGVAAARRAGHLAAVEERRGSRRPPRRASRAAGRSPTRSRSRTPGARTRTRPRPCP